MSSLGKSKGCYQNLNNCLFTCHKNGKWPRNLKCVLIFNRVAATSHNMKISLTTLFHNLPKKTMRFAALKNNEDTSVN